MLFSCLAFTVLGKSMGAENTVLPVGQLPVAAFTVLAQLCASERDRDGHPLIHQNDGERNFEIFLITMPIALL